MTVPPFQSEEEARLAAAYARRREAPMAARYDPMGPAGAWNELELARTLVPALGRVCPTAAELGRARILEVGCGTGSQLLRLVALGASPALLAGIDLLPERISVARQRHPDLDFRCGNAMDLPWASASFDLVLQITCLSSVLDPRVRQGIAAEMLRVLRPGGTVLSYDFVWNPRNRDTVGIGRAEHRRLFPGCPSWSRRCTLAPPLARSLVPGAAWLAEFLARVPCLCFHRITLLRRPPETV
jgi:SAM-dependent methyltransferase